MNRWMMKRGTMALLPVVTTLAIAFTSQEPEPNGSDDFWWTDLDAARAHAETSGRPLFIVFRCEP